MPVNPLSRRRSVPGRSLRLPRHYQPLRRIWLHAKLGRDCCPCREQVDYAAWNAQLPTLAATRDDCTPCCRARRMRTDDTDSLRQHFEEGRDYQGTEEA